MAPNTSELTWAAGFFDGEGHTTAVRYKRRQKTHPYGHQALMLEVSQSGDPCVLERFRLALGFGKIYGPYVRSGRTHCLPVYRFQIRSFEQVQAAIALIWNWLSEPKRRQARAALRAYLQPLRHHKHGVQRRFRKVTLK